MNLTEQKTDTQERQRKILLDTYNSEQDPYLFKNQLGNFECRLCLTSQFNNIATYIAHT